MDEPEAALSFTSCLQLVALIQKLGQSGAQVVCATHSPLLAATPGADIVEIGEERQDRCAHQPMLSAHRCLCPRRGGLT
jgi:predicted ATPase